MEVGYFRVTDRPIEEVSGLLHLKDTIKDLPEKAMVLDVGSGLNHLFKGAVNIERPDVTIVCIDPTLGINSDKTFKITVDPKLKDAVTYSSNKYDSDINVNEPVLFQEKRREKLVGSVAALAPVLPFTENTFNLIVDSMGPGMYLDRREDREGYCQMRNYLEEVVRVLKSGGEFRLYPLDWYADALLNDVEKNEFARDFFKKELAKFGDNIVCQIYEEPNPVAGKAMLRLGLVLRKK